MDNKDSNNRKKNESEKDVIPEEPVSLESETSSEVPDIQKASEDQIEKSKTAEMNEETDVRDKPEPPKSEKIILHFLPRDCRLSCCASKRAAQEAPKAISENVINEVLREDKATNTEDIYGEEYWNKKCKECQSKTYSDAGTSPSMIIENSDDETKGDFDGDEENFEVESSPEEINEKIKKRSFDCDEENVELEVESSAEKMNEEIKENNFDCDEKNVELEAESAAEKMNKEIKKNNSEDCCEQKKKMKKCSFRSGSVNSGNKNKEFDGDKKNVKLDVKRALKNKSEKIKKSYSDDCSVKKKAMKKCSLRRGSVNSGSKSAGNKMKIVDEGIEEAAGIEEKKDKKKVKIADEDVKEAASIKVKKDSTSGYFVRKKAAAGKFRGRSARGGLKRRPIKRRPVKRRSSVDLDSASRGKKRSINECDNKENSKEAPDSEVDDENESDAGKKKSN